MRLFPTASRLLHISGVCLALSAIVLLYPGVTQSTPVHQHPIPPLKSLIGHYLASRHGQVTVSVYDVLTQQVWNYNPTMRNDTASIVKVGILETRLHQTHGHLSNNDRQLATSMIEVSDNDAATALWNEDGGPSGIAAYNRRVGLHCTHPSDDWGLTQTCAADQVRLLTELAFPNKLLSNSSRDYELGLMRHVVSSEDWGVSGGVPRNGTTIALKNGWLPYGSAPWYVNSIGIISGHGRRYLIAVLTRDGSESTGITTIEGISAIVWKYLKPLP